METIKELVDQFRYNIKDYKSGNFNETNTRQQFIDKFFELLGWDVNNKFGYSEQYKEVVLEDRLKIDGNTKAPDYSFRIGGKRIFFVEAKKPSINIKDDIEPAYQIRRYSWTAKLPIGILTDFEELAIYDTRIKPNAKDKAGLARIKYLNFEEYEENREWIYNTLSKEAVMKGALDKYIQEGKKKGTQSVDTDFLNMIDDRREALAKNIYLRYGNERNWDLDRLNSLVGNIVDKIIFLRIAEDKKIENSGTLEKIGQGKEVWKNLIKYFANSDKKYGSGLFDNIEIFRKFELDDKILKKILLSLYYPVCPYEFSVLGVDILGNIYEKFLGKTIVKHGRTITTEFKPEVKKAGGVFYTPQYIVDYIVKNTVGELLKNKTTKQALELNIVDPACGSGAFLIGTYNYILDWFISQHTKDETTIRKSTKEGKIYQFKDGYHLSFAHKKEILRNMIYGVDIDRQAVAVSKLSLLLKLLEGETAETANQLFSTIDAKLLPNLDDNIKCGNSLVDSSIYENLENPDEETIKKINAFDWEKEFGEVFEKGGFDVVVGNPPYIKEYTNKEIFDYIKLSNLAEYYQGKMDFRYLFACKGLDILKKGGLQSFIAPNNWISNAGASKMRQKIIQESKIETFVDFIDFMVFQNASIQTMVYILKNKTPEKKYNLEYMKVLDGKITETELSSVLNNDKIENIKEKIKKGKVGISISDYQNGEQISFVSGGLIKIIEKIKEKGNFRLTEKEVAQGIVGAPDKEYLINNIIHLTQEEKPFVKRFYTNIKRYNNGGSKNHIIYLNKDNFGDRDIKDLPNIYSFFEPKKKILQEARIKLKTPNKPYYFLHRERDPRFFDFGDKIICGTRVIIPSFHFTKEEYYGSRALNFIKTDRISLKYLTGILNSKLVVFWLKNKGKLLGKMLQIDKGPLLKIPIVYNEDKENKLIELVDQMLLAQNRLREVEFDDDKKTIEKQIEIIDRKIDGLVFDLYGLSEEERNVVLGG